MRLSLRLFVERLPEDRVAATVLHLPPEAEPPLIRFLLGGPEEDPDGPAAGVDRLLGSPLPAARMTAVADDLDQAKQVLAERLRKRISDLEPHLVPELIRYFPDESLDRAEARVAPIGPDEKELPGTLVSFAIVVTTLPRPPHRVTVPKLGIALAVADPQDARAAAEAEIAAILKREPDLRRLERVHELFPAPEERLETLELDAAVMTPLDAIELRRKDAKAVGERRAKADQEELESVADDLQARAREGKLEAAHEHEDAVRECVAFIRGSAERAIVLVGPSGAGKTAALHEALRRLAADASSPSPPVYHVGGAQIVAGMSFLGAWQERCRAIVDACARRKAVLSVGDPHELIDSGPSTHSRTTIAQVLKRPLEEGKVRLIGECTTEGWEALERRDRGFAGLFRAVRVPEPDRARTLAILERVAEEISGRRSTQRGGAEDAEGRGGGGRAQIGIDALAASYDLERRFSPYAAFPGKSVRFLRRLGRELPFDPARRFGRADMVRAFARATGLPEALLSDDIALDPDEVRARLRRRIVGQERAVHAVAGLVARVKAGVSDPSRPLGSFLFLGPTGVGKTETAKALAELIFGTEKRLTRIDMSEYQDRRAAARLVGGARGDGEGELVRRVRAEPLSVLLLDEIEKADPGVFDLLLQILGEARLTDARGRTTDFRSAIVILTSNLGAEEPEGALGFAGTSGAADDAAAASASERFVAAAEGFFRPELVARLDAIIPFRPLPREAIRRIAAREVDRALARDGLARRGVSATVEAAIVERAIDAGFHPRYGARPLKRAVERWIVNPIATTLAARNPPPRRLRVELDAEGRAEAIVELGAEREGGPLVHAPAGPSTPLRTGVEEALVRARISAEELMRRIAGLRRTAVDLARDDAMLDARDEVETLEAQRRRESGRRKRKEMPLSVPRFDASPDGARLRRLASALEEAAKARRAAEELEDLAALAFVESDHAALEGLATEVTRVEALVAAAAFGVRALRFNPANTVALLLAPLERGQGGSGKSLVMELARLYVVHAKMHKLDVYAYVERRAADKPRSATVWVPVSQDRPLGAGVGWIAVDTFAGERKPLPEPLRLKALPDGPGDGGAVGLLILGDNAVPRFIAEAGRHRLVPAKAGDSERTALVRCLAIESVPLADLAFERLRTLKLPSEKSAPGIPASIPEVVRVYDERGTPAVVRDARSMHSISYRHPEELSGAPLDGFAEAFLASAHGARAATESNADADPESDGGSGGGGSGGPGTDAGGRGSS